MEGKSSRNLFFKLFSVYGIAILFCGTIAIWGLVAPLQITDTAQAMTGYMLKNLDWFFLLICTGMLALCLYLAFGPYAHLKLGREEDEPEFSTASWLSMLFAAGMGCGLLFWGVAEPMYHYMVPPGMKGETPEAARAAMVITNFHWGLHAWGIYAMSAMVLAYFGFRKSKPYLPSTPIRTAFSGKQTNLICNIADIVAVLSVVFGVAGSLASGVMQINAGLSSTFSVPNFDLTTCIVVLIAVTILYMLSASTGLDKGIKILSNINMLTAVLLLLFVLFIGPTRFIMEIFVTTIGDYASNLVNMSFRLFPYRNLQQWSTDWTLTYLIWWIAWGPFVGIFIARISRGRTIREFVIGVLFIPTLFSILWFAVFGGAGFHIEMFGGGGLGDLIIEDPTSGLFVLFDYYPLTMLLNIVGLFLIFVFLVTSADSATFVVSMITGSGTLNPATRHKLQWGIIIAVISGVTFFSGEQGIKVAKAIAISGAVPFSVILLLQIVAFMRVLRSEPKS